MVTVAVSLLFELSSFDDPLEVVRYVGHQVGILDLSLSPTNLNVHATDEVVQPQDVPFPVDAPEDAALRALLNGVVKDNRSDSLYRLAREVIEAAKRKAVEISVDHIAGILRKTDERYWRKYVDRSDANKRWRECALAALDKQGDSQQGGQFAGEPAVVSFPIHILPEPFRSFVIQAAKSLVAPPEFVALALLVAVGSAIGGGLEIELKEGWSEGPNLYAAIVGDPGSKKSPALNQALQPLHQLQRRLADEHKRRLEEWKQEVDAWEKDDGPKPERPVFRHLLTTDATTEALGPMLELGTGILLVKDELLAWVRAMDQYRQGKGADRQSYLSMWNRALLKIDRKGSQEPIIVYKPSLSVIGCLQPDLLGDLADPRQLEDGFVDRILFTFPDPVSDHWVAEGISRDLVEAICGAFDRLYQLTAARYSPDTGARIIRMDEQGQMRFAQWYNSHVAESEAEAFPSYLAGPWAKMPSQLGRLIVILHALHDCDCPLVSRPTVQAGIELVEYFKSHCRRVHHRMRANRQKSVVVRVLKALKERGRLSQTQLLYDVFQHNVSADKIKAALDELQMAGLVKSEKISGTRGRPAVYWELT